MVLLVSEFVAFILFMVGVCAYAIAAGSTEERQAAIIFISAVAITNVASAFGTSHWRSINWSVAAVDSIYLLWLLHRALNSKKFWPLWTAASQFNAVATHLPAYVFPDLPMRLYAMTQAFWAFPLLLSILAGTIAVSRADRLK